MKRVFYWLILSVAFAGCSESNKNNDFILRDAEYFKENPKEGLHLYNWCYQSNEMNRLDPSTNQYANCQLFKEGLSPHVLQEAIGIDGSFVEIATQMSELGKGPYKDIKPILLSHEEAKKNLPFNY